MTDQAPSEAQAPATPSRAEAIARVKALKEELKREEAKTGPSGAMPNAPTGQILDASGASAANPDKRFRWVSANKAMRRQVEGYVRVPEVEGGKQVGNLILMALPREVYDARVAAVKRLNAERLKSHVREMEEAAEGLAKYLRDEKGINVRAEDILVKG